MAEKDDARNRKATKKRSRRGAAAEPSHSAVVSSSAAQAAVDVASPASDNILLENLSEQTLDELFRVATAHMQAGRNEQASAVYLKLLAKKPDCFEAHLNLGNTFYNRGRFQDALFHYRETTKINPTCTDAFFNAGNTLGRLGKPEEAVAEYRLGLDINPDHIPARAALAGQLAGLNRKSEAEAELQRVLKQDQNCVVALLLLGNLSLDQGKFKDAENCYRRLLNIRPDVVEAYFSLGNAYKAQNRAKDAIIAFKQALTLKPDFLPALTNLGHALLSVDQVDAAIASFKKVLALDPDSYDALNNLGNAHFSKRHSDEGVKYYNRAVALREQEAQAHWNRSLTLLLRGEYEKGWAGFEWRLKGSSRPMRNFTRPAWDGSNPKGKTILVYLEQGFGDCFHCVRYVPMLVERGARVLLEYRDSLKRLFTCFENVTLVAEKDNDLVYDYQVAVMSLPHLLGTTKDNIPGKVPYLFAPEECNPKYELGLKRRPRIGFLWKGNPHQGADRYRSAKLEDLKPILDVPEFEFVCLQQVLTEQEIAELRRMEHVKVFERGFGDYADTASVIDQLDLVISVDTGVSHLAGAMAKPVWLALCQNSSWQWLIDRADSPWYPTARLFRQKTLHCWEEPISEILLALKKEFSIQKLPGEFAPDDRIAPIHKYYDARNFVAALDLCQTFMPSHPEYPEALHMRALIACAHKEFAEAQRLMTEAIALSPTNDNFLEALAQIYLKAGEEDLALLAFRRALEARPSNVTARVGLAGVLFRRGLVAEAKKEIEVGLACEPGHVQALVLHGRIFRSQSRIAEALKCLRKADRACPGDPQVQAEIAASLAARGDFRRAAEHYEASLKAGALHQDVYLEYAEALLRQKKCTQACSILRRALEVAPNSALAWKALAKAQALNGERRAAIESCYRSLQCDPDNIDTTLELAEFYLEDGQLIEVKIACAQVLRSNRDSEAARKILDRLRDAKAAGLEKTPDGESARRGV